MDKCDELRHLEKELDPDFAFVFKKPDSDLIFCLFTTQWFRDPDFKIQIWFCSNQTGLKSITQASQPAGESGFESDSDFWLG